MALTQGAARTGLPMKKSSVPINLKTEVERKNRDDHLEFFLGVVGMARSGRKTLAYRFANMNLPIIEHGQVPVQYTYTAILPGFFRRSQDPQGSYTVRLISYIIEPPAELDAREPPLYWERWDDFSCMIFVFDVRNLASFHEASRKLFTYRQANLRLPRCILVGNKSDRRNDHQPENPEEPEFDLVSELTGLLEARNLGVDYFEVSARNRTDVNALLFKIVKLDTCIGL